MAMLHSLIARRRFRPQTQWRPLRKILTSGLGLDDVFGLARRGSTVGFHLLWHTVELAMSTRLCLLQWLIVLFSLWTFWTFWIVIRLWIYDFGLRLWYHDRNYFDALTDLGAFMRTEFLCVSLSRVASEPRVKLASCKSALNRTVAHSTDRSKAVVPVIVLLFVVLWFILRGDLLYVFPCVNLFLCFSVLLVLRLPRLGKRELILVLFVRLFDLCLFGFVGFLFLLGSRKGCLLWLWHSLDFSLTFCFPYLLCYSLYLWFICP